MQPCRGGMGFLARRSGATVLPVVICRHQDGTAGAMRRRLRRGARSWSATASPSSSTWPAAATTSRSRTRSATGSRRCCPPPARRLRGRRARLTARPRSPQRRPSVPARLRTGLAPLDPPDLPASRRASRSCSWPWSPAWPSCSGRSASRPRRLPRGPLRARPWSRLGCGRRLAPGGGALGRRAGRLGGSSSTPA